MTRRVTTLLIVAALGAAACLFPAVATSRASSASSASPSASATGGATLRVGWTADPDNLNPFIGVETASSEVLGLTYDRLFTVGLEGKPIPMLAAELPTQENGGISADGKTWAVHLRPGITWQDGSRSPRVTWRSRTTSSSTTDSAPTCRPSRTSSTPRPWTTPPSVSP